MERAQQLVDADGLKIPLPFMAQYGLQPGSEVTVELHDDVICIIPKLLGQHEIETRALRLLLKSLGDAILVRARQLSVSEAGKGIGDWRVDVYARGHDDPLGYLDFTRNGLLLSDLSATLDEIRHRAATMAKNP